MSYGNKMSEMEISQRNAPKTIAALNDELSKTKDSFSRRRIKEKIAAQKNALNYTQFQKSFSSTMYGGIEMYAERLGSLGYVTRANQFLNIGGSTARRGIYQYAGNVFNLGVEIGEETATLMSQNAVD